MKLQWIEILAVCMILAAERVSCSSKTRYTREDILLEGSTLPYSPRWNPSESEVIRGLTYENTVYIQNIGERLVLHETLPENTNSMLISNSSRIDSISNGFYFYREYRTPGPTYIINPGEEVYQTKILLSGRNMGIKSVRKLQNKISKCREQYPRYFTQTKKYLESAVELFRLVLYKREILKARKKPKKACSNLKNLIENMYLEARLLRKNITFKESIKSTDIRTFINNMSVLDARIEKSEREIEDINAQSMLGWLYKMDPYLVSFMLELYPEVEPERLLRESARRIEAAFTRNEDSLYKAVVNESKVDPCLLYTAGEIYNLIKHIEYLGIAMQTCTEIWGSVVVVTSSDRTNNGVTTVDFYYNGIGINIYLAEADIQTIVRAKDFSDIKNFINRTINFTDYSVFEKLIFNDRKSLRRSSI